MEFVQDDLPENWTWADNVVYGGTIPINIEGMRVTNPHLDFRENGLAYPTEETPFSNGEIHQNELLDADFLGNDRMEYKTLGAIQYPVISKRLGFLTEEMVGPDSEKPVLSKKIPVPESLRTRSHGLVYGGDIRIGDLQNNRQAAFIVYRAAVFQDGGATQPCFLGAFTQDGDVLWTKGEGGFQPNRPGPVVIHDIDADGNTEVITLFMNDPDLADPYSMNNVTIQILNGETGKIERIASPPELTSSRGEGPNWVHQRILIANLSGNKTPQDLIIKLGTKIIAFNHDLNVLWTYENNWNEYQNCPAYIPSVGDMDNDGLDEINGGYYVLNADGKPVWEKKLGKNMDSVTINSWDHKQKKRAFGSGFGLVLDKTGNMILNLGEETVPHGQELRVADFDENLPGNEMVIRYNGHNEQVILVGNDGKIIQRFNLNRSPNNTGMEVVYWSGTGKPARLYNGGMLWKGDGSLFFELPGLPGEQGERRQGWYHCIPADIVNDGGEEAIVYNPWRYEIFVFSRDQSPSGTFQGYQATSRQYNVRLMD
jgi:hypothetical protein